VSLQRGGNFITPCRWRAAKPCRGGTGGAPAAASASSGSRSGSGVRRCPGTRTRSRLPGGLRGESCRWRRLCTRSGPALREWVSAANRPVVRIGSFGDDSTPASVGASRTRGFSCVRCETNGACRTYCGVFWPLGWLPTARKKSILGNFSKPPERAIREYTNGSTKIGPKCSNCSVPSRFIIKYPEIAVRRVNGSVHPAVSTLRRRQVLGSSRNTSSLLRPNRPLCSLSVRRPFSTCHLPYKETRPINGARYYPNLYRRPITKAG